VDETTTVYVCPRCFSTDEAAGPCPRCGPQRLRCELGAPDSDFRRPPHDADGRLLSRAPLWWLVRGAPYLRNLHNEHK
jgi:hypothetical protein